MADPYGICKVFESHLTLALKEMPPPQAAREAIRAVDAYIAGSKFIDLNAKGESGSYLRVDRDPNETRAAIPRMG